MATVNSDTQIVVMMITVLLLMIYSADNVSTNDNDNDITMRRLQPGLPHLKIKVKYKTCGG